MLKKATDDDGMIIYTPLYVSTQVVAGTNYKFWCIWDVFCKYEAVNYPENGRNAFWEAIHDPQYHLRTHHVFYLQTM